MHHARAVVYLCAGSPVARRSVFLSWKLSHSRGTSASFTHRRALIALGTLRYGQPAAYLFMKQMKSATFSTGAAVEPSQFAYEPPAAYVVLKQT